jgi:hypothetical protein
MKPCPYSRSISGLLIAVCLLACFPVTTAAFEDGDVGWQPGHFVPAEPWQENRIELPPYPQKGDLLAVNISTGGQPYRLYLDPGALSKDSDGVVRYTVVLISAADVWNVSYEGLRCGERSYRRYAYGVGGEWRAAGDSPWMPVAGLGINRYRKIFYDYFMCNPSERITDVEDILRNIRSPSSGIRD